MPCNMRVVVHGQPFEDWIRRVLEANLAEVGSRLSLYLAARFPNWTVEPSPNTQNKRAQLGIEVNGFWGIDVLLIDGKVRVDGSTDEQQQLCADLTAELDQFMPQLAGLLLQQQVLKSVQQNYQVIEKFNQGDNLVIRFTN